MGISPKHIKKSAQFPGIPVMPVSFPRTANFAGTLKGPLPLPGEQKNTRPAFYGRPCVLKSYAVLSEKAHLTAFRQVAQSAHLTQAVDDAAANAGGLLQLLDGEVLLSMEGGVFQRIGSGTAQTFQ